MEKIVKKEITERTAVKAFINGFVSYGLIFSFVILIIIAFIRLVTQNLKITNEFNYMIINSILKSIIFFFLILFVCRISTFDVLKKCKLKISEIDSIKSSMTKFFIICCVFSLMVFSFNLSIKYLNMQNDLYQVSTSNYETFKDSDLNIAASLTNIEISKKKDSWFKYKVCSCIVETTIFASCLYLISYQKKMIDLYNV